MLRLLHFLIFFQNSFCSCYTTKFPVWIWSRICNLGFQKFLPKKLARRVDLLGQTLSRKLVFKKFGSEPPLMNAQLRPQGGLRVRNYLELIWKISLSCERCWRPHEKILFLARDIIFCKSRFVCNYSMHKKWQYSQKNRDTRKLLWCTFLRKPPIQNFWSLVYTFLGWISTDLIWGFEKFYFFRILWPKNGRHIGFLSYQGL